jgi:hypothetical protein
VTVDTPRTRCVGSWRQANRAWRCADDQATPHHPPGRSLGGGGSLCGSCPAKWGDVYGWVDIEFVEHVDLELLDVDVNYIYIVVDHDVVHYDHDDAAR